VLCLVALAAGTAAARDADRPFRQWELDQLLAPIALYPDALLSQVLMAATYPVEVVEAARWSRRNPHLRGDDAVWAVEREDWDPSVKSLVAFPVLLSTMDERLEWTRDVGDAFLEQREDVIDSVQELRRRAWEAGLLRSDERLRYLDLGNAIAIEPTQPGMLFVPWYDPVAAFGVWGWPEHPPVRWSAWPGYEAPVAAAPVQRWGSGVRISVGLFFGAFDWPRRTVQVVHVNNYYRRTVVVERQVEVHPRPPVFTVVREVPRPWQHDPGHRRGVAYRRDTAPGPRAGSDPTPRVSPERPQPRPEPMRAEGPRPTEPRPSAPQRGPREDREDRADRKGREARAESPQATRPAPVPARPAADRPDEDRRPVRATEAQSPERPRVTRGEVVREAQQAPARPAVPAAPRRNDDTAREPRRAPERVAANDSRPDRSNDRGNDRSVRNDRDERDDRPGAGSRPSPAAGAGAAAAENRGDGRREGRRERP